LVTSMVLPRMAGHLAKDYRWRPMRAGEDKQPVFFTAGPFEVEGKQ